MPKGKETMRKTGEMHKTEEIINKTGEINKQKMDKSHNLMGDKK
jgi:hypothetical protein